METSPGSRIKLITYGLSQQKIQVKVEIIMFHDCPEETDTVESKPEWPNLQRSTRQKWPSCFCDNEISGGVAVGQKALESARSRIRLVASEIKKPRKSQRAVLCTHQDVEHPDVTTYANEKWDIKTNLGKRQTLWSFVRHLCHSFPSPPLASNCYISITTTTTTVPGQKVL